MTAPVAQVRADVVLRGLTRSESDCLLAGRGRPPRGLRWHAEYPTPDTVVALALLTEAQRHGSGTAPGLGWSKGRRPPRPVGWWLSQIVVDGIVVGDIGFHGPPAHTRPVTVEIGYCIVPSRRGEGIASAGCRLLLDQAWRDGAELVTATATADNPASRAVLRHAGFRYQGGDQFEVHRP